MAKDELIENGTYIVRNGELELLEKPPSGFGRTTIHWQDDKPVTLEVNYTKKILKTK